MVESFAEIRQILADMAKQRAEEDKKEAERRQEADREMKALKKRIDDVGRNIGELTNGWGKFVEDLVSPGVRPALKRFGYRVNTVMIRVEAFRNGGTMEVDALALALARGGKGVVIAAQIRSRLTRDSVAEWIGRLDDFFKYFPEYRDRELQGMVGGIRLDEGVDKFAVQSGLFMLASSGDAVRVVNPTSFKPRVWRHAGP